MKRLLLIVVLIIVSLTSVSAQNFIEKGDSLYDVVVTRSDVDIIFNNDTLHPWTVVDNAVVFYSDGVDKNYSSCLNLTLNTSNKVELSFDWQFINNSSYHEELVLYVDGERRYSTTSSSYYTKRFYLEPGEHTLMFRDSIGNSSSTSYGSKIKNIQIKQILPLESVILTGNSKPLTFTNDSEWPWTIEDGYVQNSNYGNSNTLTTFSTTFTIDKLSKLSFNYRGGYWYNNNFSSSSTYTDYHRFKFYINGELYSWWKYATSFSNISVALEPGTYTLVWEDTIMANHPYTYFTQIKDIELTDNWVEVNVPMSGTLGVEVLYLVNVLDDIELLKVTGTLNSADWASISQMNNLVAIDLSEAKTTSVPNNAFDGLARLSYCKLPEGVNSIGDYAFRGTQILNIDIPNSVTSIGNGAFYQTRVRSINFGLESELKTIGYQAFYACTSLTEFIMPDGVEKLLYVHSYNDGCEYNNTFDCCTGLKKIHFSDALKVLEGEVCRDCSNLKEVHLPKNIERIGSWAFSGTSCLEFVELPDNLQSIQKYAFYGSGIDSLRLPIKLSTLERNAFENCSKLKYIELPSYIECNYTDGFFYGCKSVQTIVVKSATPPAIKTDMFGSSNNAPNKSSVMLKVPSFAIVNYKLDPYWYQFGQIVAADDDIDYWKITGPLSLTNNRRMNGKPDIDLYNGGQLLVSGDAPMEIGQFTLYPNQSNPGSLLNMCDVVTADSISTELSFDAKKWYFITPLHDVVISNIEVTNDALYVFRYYDGASRAANGTGNSWRNVEDIVLYAGQGYIFQSNKATTLRMPAKSECHIQVFNTGDITKPLAEYASDASSNSNWNFVGNPYPCYYDVYYMDFAAPITVWNGSTYKAYSIVDDDYVLSPGQAFFVQKPDEGNSIIFHKEGRQLTTEISRVSYAGARSQGRSIRYLFDLKIMSDELYDETRVVINDAASTGYEIKCDASKFMSFESGVPQICTVDGDDIYAINERPLADGIIKLAYSATAPGMMTISAIRTDGSVYLYDEITNKTVNLAEQDYNFYSDVTDGLDDTRFRLLLDSNVLTGIDSPIGNKGSLVKAQNGGITVNAPAGSGIVVYSIEGVKVYETTANGAQAFVALPAGVYLVKVNAETVRILVY